MPRENIKYMIDFHSHILPKMDDGSQSLEESLKMLELCSEQDITTIAATPHFYAGQDTPEQFLHRRKVAAERLRAEWKNDSPQLLLGAEVYYYPGIHLTEALCQMRLEGTSLLLLEMPFCRWTSEMVDEVLAVNCSSDVQVVLAHVDRYLSMQHPGVMERLLSQDVLLQANADSFLNWRKRKKMLRMMQQGTITFLGSDCHDLVNRPPCMGKAMKIIEQKLGIQYIEKLNKEEDRIVRIRKVVT